jgi:molecular chaperone DnaK (HSP70)
MLPFILARSVSVDYVALDIGSQFFKLAHSKPDGSVQIFTDKVTNSVIIPSAVAVKFLVPHSLPLSPRDYEDIEVRTGHKALSVLRSNSSLGSAFVPRTIGRSGPSEFKTSKVASDLVLLTMLIYNAMRMAPSFNIAAVAVPSYWTREQLQAVSQACRIFDIPLGGLVTDVHAVLTLYATMRLSRFQKEPSHVLFVDVGATSTKVFAANFTYDK